MYQTLGEPIEVLAVFQKGKIKPLSFKWKSRVYKISRITSHWSAPVGKYKWHHFGIIDKDDNFFEICYDEEKYAWNIKQTWKEG